MHHARTPPRPDQAHTSAQWSTVSISAVCDPSAHRFGTTAAAPAATKWPAETANSNAIIHTRTARVCERVARIESRASHKFDLISTFRSNADFYRWYDSLKRADCVDRYSIVEIQLWLVCGAQIEFTCLNYNEISNQNVWYKRRYTQSATCEQTNTSCVSRDILIRFCFCLFPSDRWSSPNFAKPNSFRL